MASIDKYIWAFNMLVSINMPGLTLRENVIKCIIKSESFFLSLHYIFPMFTPVPQGKTDI